ncbi:MAG TPA: hypothetical protein PLN42_11865 [Anaerolineae bacterium]|mgnify:CR=1 FL=1|nr:hypothetical protein [Anaerolineae bacterium]
MPFNRLLVVGFFLVVIGAVLPFLIVLHYVPSTFLLNILAYMASTVGIFLAVLGVALHVGKARKRQQDDDWYDR